MCEQQQEDENSKPIAYRIEEWARSSSAPIARSTYEGSKEAEVHALQKQERFSVRGAFHTTHTADNSSDFNILMSL